VTWTRRGGLVRVHAGEDDLHEMTLGKTVALTVQDGRQIDARVTELRPLGEFATWARPAPSATTISTPSVSALIQRQRRGTGGRHDIWLTTNHSSRLSREIVGGRVRRTGSCRRKMLNKPNTGSHCRSIVQTVCSPAVGALVTRVLLRAIDASFVGSWRFSWRSPSCSSITACPLRTRPPNESTSQRVFTGVAKVSGGPNAAWS